MIPDEKPTDDASPKASKPDDTSPDQLRRPLGLRPLKTHAFCDLFRGAPDNVSFDSASLADRLQLGEARPSVCDAFILLPRHVLRVLAPGKLRELFGTYARRSEFRKGLPPLKADAIREGCRPLGEAVAPTCAKCLALPPGAIDDLSPSELRELFDLRPGDRPALLKTFLQERKPNPQRLFTVAGYNRSDKKGERVEGERLSYPLPLRPAGSSWLRSRIVEGLLPDSDSIKTARGQREPLEDCIHEVCRSFLGAANHKSGAPEPRQARQQLQDIKKQSDKLSQSLKKLHAVEISQLLFAIQTRHSIGPKGHPLSAQEIAVFDLVKLATAEGGSIEMHLLEILSDIADQISEKPMYQRGKLSPIGQRGLDDPREDIVRGACELYAMNHPYSAASTTPRGPVHELCNLLFAFAMKKQTKAEFDHDQPDGRFENVIQDVVPLWKEQMRVKGEQHSIIQTSAELEYLENGIGKHKIGADFFLLKGLVSEADNLLLEADKLVAYLSVRDADLQAATARREAISLRHKELRAATDALAKSMGDAED